MSSPVSRSSTVSRANAVRVAHSKKWSSARALASYGVLMDLLAAFATRPNDLSSDPKPVLRGFGQVPKDWRSRGQSARDC